MDYYFFVDAAAAVAAMPFIPYFYGYIWINPERNRDISIFKMAVFMRIMPFGIPFVFCHRPAFALIFGLALPVIRIRLN